MTKSTAKKATAAKKAAPKAKRVTNPHLNPVLCANVAQVKRAATAGGRRRPVEAIDDEGNLVVCCSRTARKHGWELVARLFKRGPSGASAGIVLSKAARPQ